MNYWQQYMTVDDGARLLVAWVSIDIIMNSEVVEAYFTGLLGVTQ